MLRTLCDLLRPHTRWSNRARAPRLSLERLESRETPAAFNIPWADARHLTLSFVPDGTLVSTLPSNLFATMNATLPTSTWQGEILRAFQTWANQANINVAWHTDLGQPLGTAGAAQGAPSFGDIRIAAAPLAPDVFSVAVPHDPFLSGTWSGDVLFNSNVQFGPNGQDLFTVALHEAGHVLGLDHSTDPNSAMFPTFAQPRLGLAAGDIASLQGLYGMRAPDTWDAAKFNDSLKNATRIRYENTGVFAFRGATPLVTFGDITTTRDVDLYWIQPFAGYTGPVTFRLQSAGKSLLAPSLTVLDSAGRVLGQASSTSALGDTVSVTLSSVNPSSLYYIRVEGARRDAFGVGAYALATTFDANLTTSAAQLDAVIRGPYETLTYNDLQALFGAGEHFLNDDRGANDTFLTAGRLQAALGYPANSHYDVVASLANAGDVDMYQLKSPSFASKTPGVLTATVWSLDPTGQAPQVDIYDRNLVLLPSRLLANGNGTYTVQVAGVESGKQYFAAVHSRRGLGVGNYSMALDFGTRAAIVQNLAAGVLPTANVVQNLNLYVAKTQLFHLLLSAQSQLPGTVGAVRMTIMDAGGNIVASLTANGGETVSSPDILLKPGTYQVRVESLSVNGQPPAAMVYSIVGDNGIIPIGPVANDPSFQTQFTNPNDTTTFIYPGGTVTSSPYLWALLTV